MARKKQVIKLNGEEIIKYSENIDHIDTLNHTHLPGRFNNFFVCYIYSRLLKDIHTLCYLDEHNKKPSYNVDVDVSSAIVREERRGHRRKTEGDIFSSIPTHARTESYELALKPTKYGGDADMSHLCGASYDIKTNYPAAVAIKELLAKAMAASNLMLTYINNNSFLDRALDIIQIELLKDYMKEEDMGQIYRYGTMLKKVQEYRKVWRQTYTDIFHNTEHSEVEQVLIDCYANFVKEPRIYEKEYLENRSTSEIKKELLKEQIGFTGEDVVIGVDEHKTVCMIQKCIANAVNKVNNKCGGNIPPHVTKFFETIQQSWHMV